MKFPTDRPVKVVMLGAGGTGGYVAPYVFRLLHMLDRPSRFVVCDGDIVEPKNLDRQNFVPADLGENKARVLAERYSTVLGMETEYVPSFIEKLPDLMELIEPKEWELNPYSTKRTKEMVLLLGCVDNNKTRQLCHQAFHQSEELIYIDSGNGKYTQIFRFPAWCLACGFWKTAKSRSVPWASLRMKRQLWIRRCSFTPFPMSIRMIGSARATMCCLGIERFPR